MAIRTKKEWSKWLWEQCFDDEKAFVDFYFSRIYKDEYTYLSYVGDRAVSHVEALPYLLSFQGDRYPIHYISGACTLAEFRGQGLMQQLMAAALQDRAEKGDDLSFLIPANEGLFDFYAKMGYQTLCYYRLSDEGELWASFLPECLPEVGLEQLIALCQEQEPFPRVLHGSEVIKTILASLEVDSELSAITLGDRGSRGVAFVDQSAGAAVVRDLFTSRAELPLLLEKIRREVAQPVLFRLPARQLDLSEGTAIPYAMGKALSLRGEKLLSDFSQQDPLFMSLMFD